MKKLILAVLLTFSVSATAIQIPTDGTAHPLGPTLMLAPPLVDSDGQNLPIPHCTTDEQGRLVCSYF